MNEDVKLEEPSHLRIRQHLEQRMRDGELEQGDKLPTIRDMAKRYSVAPGTMQRVLRDMARDGLVRGVRGSGVYVTFDGAPETAPDVLRISEMDNLFSAKEMESVFARFKEAFPAAHCQTVPDLPDVLEIVGDDVPALASQLEDVTELVETLFDRPYSERRVFNAFHLAGRHVMLPVTVMVNPIICHGPMFAAEGIPLPDGAWNWNEFVELAHALTRAKDGVYGFHPSGHFPLLFIAGVWQRGGRVYSPDGARCLLAEGPGLEMAECLRQLRGAVSPDLTQDLWKGAPDVGAFAEGRVAMSLGTIWFPEPLYRRGFRDIPWRAAVQPHDGVEEYVLQTFGLAVRREARNKDMARAFLKAAASWEKWPDKINHTYSFYMHNDLRPAPEAGDVCSRMATFGRTPLSDVLPECRSHRHSAALWLLELGLRQLVISDAPVKQVMEEAVRNVEFMLRDEHAWSPAVARAGL